MLITNHIGLIMGKKAPNLSIIICTLNEEKSIGPLLEDIFKQNYHDYEVILVDAKSIDQTRTIASTYKSKINLKIIISKIKHLNVQRNLGASLAKGKLLVFCDADNRLPSQFLGQLHSVGKQNPKTIVIPQVIAQSPNLKEIIWAKLLNITFSLHARIFKNPMVLEPIMLIEKKCYQKLKGINEKMIMHEGRDFIKRAKAIGYRYLFAPYPKYGYSFRRYHKYGTLSIIVNNIHSQFARPDPNNLSSPSYHPMLGGKMYEK